jgi:hypothetical protein
MTNFPRMGRIPISLTTATTFEGLNKHRSDWGGGALLNHDT